MTRPLTNQNSAEFDCVILGGGTAGCAVALALLKKDVGLRIAIIDAGQHRGERIGESLPSQSAELLHQLGVWDAFVSDEHRPCHGFSSCWGNADLGYFDFFTLPYGPAWTLDRGQFDTTLVRIAEERGVQTLRNCKALSVSFNVDGTSAIDYQRRHFQTDHSVRCRARFVIDATGRRGWLLRRMHIVKQRFDQLIMLHTRVAQHSVTATQAMTLIEATEFGWWYSSTLPNGDKLVGFFTDSDIARKLGLYGSTQWQKRLAQTRYTQQGLAPDIGAVKPGILPAMSYRPCSSHGENWLAIGDAAGTCDPLSAQGIHRALSDGIDAADAVYQALEGNTLERLDAHVQKRRAKYDRYLQQRGRYYAMETRWNDSEFWHRRIHDSAFANSA